MQDEVRVTNLSEHKVGLNYGATEYAVSNSLGITKEEALKIIDGYWKLFKVTKQFIDKSEKFILKNGFIQGAFGLKLRGDLKNITDDTKYASTLRTMNNMQIQSFGLLLTRALNEFQKRVEEAGLEEEVVLFNSIHDAAYLYIKKDVDIVHWVNENIVECFLWDYDTDWIVKMGAELEIGDNLAEVVELPNKASVSEIEKIVESL